MNTTLNLKEYPPKVTNLIFHTSGQLPERFCFDQELENTAHYMQSVKWYEHHQSEQIVAGSFVDGNLVARSIITILKAPLKLGYIYRLERGPVAVDAKSLRLHLEQLCQEFYKQSIVLEISPYHEDSESIREISEYLHTTGWHEVDVTRTFYKNSIVLNLEPELDVIRRGFRKSLKRSINKAEKSGLQCRIISDMATINELLAMYNVTAVKKCFKPLSESDRTFIREQVTRGTISVCAVYVSDEIAGGNFMLTTGNKILVEWRVFSDKTSHRAFPLAHLADWESIKWAKSNGYLYYDFAGYWLEHGDENSINRYKTGFSKNVVPVVPEYDYYKNAKILYFLITLKRHTKTIRQKLMNLKPGINKAGFKLRTYKLANSFKS